MPPRPRPPATHSFMLYCGKLLPCLRNALKSERISIGDAMMCVGGFCSFCYVWCVARRVALRLWSDGTAGLGCRSRAQCNWALVQLE